MRKPRDFDTALRALTNKTKTLKENKRRQLGELIVATGAVPVIVSGSSFSDFALEMISRPVLMMSAIRSRRTPMMSRPLPTVVPSRYLGPASTRFPILGPRP